MAHFGFDEQSVHRIVRAVKRSEHGAYQSIGRPPGHVLDAPIPMFLGKLNGTIAASCSGQATIWGATQASTAAETSQGTSETVYDWFGTGGSSSDKVMLFRQFGSERLYFQRPGTCYGGLYVSGFAFITAGNHQIEFDTALPSKGITADTSDHRLEIAVAGDYEVKWSGIVVESASVGGSVFIQLYKNGTGLTDYLSESTITNSIEQWAFSSYITLAAGDYLELFAIVPSGKFFSSNGIHFSVKRVG